MKPSTANKNSLTTNTKDNTRILKPKYKNNATITNISNISKIKTPLYNNNISAKVISLKSLYRSEDIELPNYNSEKLEIEVLADFTVHSIYDSFQTRKARNIEIFNEFLLKSVNFMINSQIMKRI